ncbi:MAG: CoxG family protein [Actinomycetota bacterium]
MNVSGEYRLDAPRGRVWAALHDPETLRACIPGCEDLRPDGRGRVMVRMGPVATVFDGRLVARDQERPVRWTFSATAHSPTAGHLDGEITVTLSEEGDRTLVGLRGQVQPGGRLATLGEGMLREALTQWTGDLFALLAVRLRQPADRQERTEPAPRPPVVGIHPIGPAMARPAPQPARLAAEPLQGPSERTKTRVLVVGTVIWAFIAFALLWPRG